MNLSSSSPDQKNATLDYCYLDRSSMIPKVYLACFISTFVFAPTVVLSGVHIYIVRKLKKLNTSDLFHVNIASTKRMLKKNHYDAELYNRTAITLKQFYKRQIKSNNNTATTTKVTTNLASSDSTAAAADAAATIPLIAFTYQCYDTSSSITLSASSNIQHNSVTKSSGNSVKDENTLYTKNLIIKRKQTITLCLISLAFFSCQIPIKAFQMFNLFYIFQEADPFKFKIIDIIFLSCKLLYFFHGMSNPIIYNLMSTKFRRSFKNAILCKALNNNYYYYYYHIRPSLKMNTIKKRGMF
jgi:hypothetical protein